MSDTNPSQVEDTFDFGFSAVTLDELEVIQETTAKLEQSDAESATLQEKLDRLYNAVQPLLNNLKADPSRDYIYWPNRMEKIEQFSDHLDGIYNAE